MPHLLKPTRPRGFAVLLVEPDPDVREYVAGLLKEAGCACVVEVEDATRAIDVISRSVVDLLVVEHRLPETDGCQLIEWAKKLEPTLPALLLTGDRCDEKLSGHLADEIYEKPLELPRLRRHVERLCHRRRASLL